MVNQKLLKILERGVERWNLWRSENRDFEVSFAGADLRRAELSGADFLDASFVSAYLDSADLSCANLNMANLSGANLSGAMLRDATLNYANLSGANLKGANLANASLMSANLNRAYLNGADLSGASLYDANLSGAILHYTNFTEAFLCGVDLKSAQLTGANLQDASISGADFTYLDLREAKGLETVRHVGPSYVSIDTIYLSQGKIPEAFLRGCGVPESFIVQIPALVAAIQPIQFYSCFISYSSKDQNFAERLHADLQNKGVRCWYAPEDLKIGEKIRVGIDESIRIHDKLLLILSKNSIESEWVEKEVETAMERERQQKRTILFPVRLDDKVGDVQSGWAADIRRSRNIGDFRRWKSHDAYSKAFERLLRDLKADA